MPQKLRRNRMVEVVRSFSYKLNCGNYESRDFFCSQKAECKAADAGTVSEALYQFCKSQVLASVREYTGGVQSPVIGRRELKPEERAS